MLRLQEFLQFEIEMTALLTQSEKFAIHNVFYKAQGQTIIEDVSFESRLGEITTIIGPNGAGKSTLIKIVSGVLSPTEGTVTIPNHWILGYVPQKIALNRFMPLKVSRFLSLAHVNREARNWALERLNILHLRAAQIHDLSGGEFQRVLLARAISRKPQLLILDEPLQGVDISGQTTLYSLIENLKDELNCAVLMVSHDLHLVMAQTDHVLCLNRHLCCHGKPEKISQHPEYIRLFGPLGRSQSCYLLTSP